MNKKDEGDQSYYFVPNNILNAMIYICFQIYNNK